MLRVFIYAEVFEFYNFINKDSSHKHVHPAKTRNFSYNLLPMKYNLPIAC